MGAHQSKEELLYQQVNYGNVEGIKALHRDGAGLEWIDKEGKTPLILACMRPDQLNVAKVLIELGANVNAYRPAKKHNLSAKKHKKKGKNLAKKRSHGGTPLHHAAKRGLEHTVNLLLSNGANPFVMNDDCLTPLEVARAKGHCNVVRAIESRICLFCGWLRELFGPSILEAFAPQWVQRKIWAVVSPCDSRNPLTPSKFELAIYPDVQTAQPRVIVALWKVHIEAPKFHQPDPALIIVDKASKTRYKFLAANEGDKQQFTWFYNACRGISQQNVIVPVAPAGAAPMPNPSQLNTNASSVSLPPPVPSHSPVPENVQLAMAINASIQSALAEGIPIPNPQPLSLTSDTSGWAPSSEKTSYSGWGQPSAAPPPSKMEPTPDPFNGWAGIRPSSSSPQLHNSQLETPVVPPVAHEAPPLSIPSAPPFVEETFYGGGPVRYPTIDSAPVDLKMPDAGTAEKSPVDSKQDDGSSSSGCVICLDAPVEGACIPCGHMAGCMSCLNEIKGKKWGCPVCRADIVQVVRLYAV